MKVRIKTWDTIEKENILYKNESKIIQMKDSIVLFTPLLEQNLPQSRIIHVTQEMEDTDGEAIYVYQVNSYTFFITDSMIYDKEEIEEKKPLPNIPKIVSIFMSRDGDSLEDATRQYEQLKSEAMETVLLGYDAVEELLCDYGLEPDYIMDLLY